MLRDLGINLLELVLNVILKLLQSFLSLGLIRVEFILAELFYSFSLQCLKIGLVLCILSPTNAAKLITQAWEFKYRHEHANLTRQGFLTFDSSLLIFLKRNHFANHRFDDIILLLFQILHGLF